MLKSLTSRVLVVLVVWLALSHLGSLWLYARKHEEAASLLQDALIADRIALMTRLLDAATEADRPRLLALLSGPLSHIGQTTRAVEKRPIVEGTRPHLFEHLVGLFLDRPDHDGIATAHRPAERWAPQPTLLTTLSGTLDPGPHHLPAGTLEEIRTTGNMTTDVRLSDGSNLQFVTPLLTVSPFSPLKLWTPLAAMLLSVLLSGAWMMSRATRPLFALAQAADRLGKDLHSAPLVERGASEVRSAVRAFNGMQDRIQRLVEDRTAFAAALAHDIGTPITRLVLRLDDVAEPELRAKMASDLGQMQRMVRATLDFARNDFQSEPSERLDVVALVQSVAADLIDAGASIDVFGPPHLVVATKPVALRRAVTNLVDNAVKYGGKTAINVAKSYQALDIRIEDQGPGIPEPLLDEAFRPFRRLGQADMEGPEGTGLGLAVARSVARSLGGDVTLENRPSGGLVVTLRIPV